MLSNVYSNWGALRKALEFARKFYQLATEMEDAVATAAAKMMINDIGTCTELRYVLLGAFDIFVR